MIFKKLALSALILGSTQFTFALSPSQEEDKLDRYYQAFENRSSELEDVDNELFGYEYKLERAQKDLQSAEQELSKAQSEYATAKAALLKDNSEDNLRNMNLTEHALKMSERGVRTRTKRLERVENNIAELTAKKEQLSKQVTEGQKRITAQEKLVQKVKADASRRLAQAEQAKAEAQRRMLEEKRLAESSRKAVEASLNKPTSPSPVSQPAVQVPTESIAAAADESPDTIDQSELSTLDREALEYAQKEIARLEDLLTDSNHGRPTYKRLTLGGNKVETEQFEFLGKDQYRVDTVVQNGRQIFQVGKHKFRRTIPASDNGAEYVFIYDAKRLSRPRLVMFKKSLLDAIN
ncbi:hypothetical protein GCM10027217_32610 [Pseudomaricurvus hydrocarbonicus]